MTERCIEITKKGINITGRVVDENGNQLQPTKEERERIISEVMDLMCYVKNQGVKRFFTDYSLQDSTDLKCLYD